jgi:hypothetical protein
LKKEIVIVNYSYPPFNTIGSRRWAKFSKELANNGHKVHVIYSKNPHKTKSVWTNDTLDDNIIKYELNNYWPKFSFNPGKNTINRIANKTFLTLINLFFKGIPNDESRFWKRPLQKTIINICTNNKIDIIISSGPPFRVLYYSLLKDQFPYIKFYSDMRDEWLSGKLFNSEISKSNYIHEKEVQDFVIKKSDKIFVTDQSNKKHIEKLYENLEDKIKVIPHTLDLDEFQIKSNSPNINNKIKFIYGGNMPMIDKEDSILPFLDALVDLQNNHTELYQKIEIQFYFNSDWMIKEIRNRNLSNIYFNKKIQPIKFNNIASKHDYLLIFLPDYLKDYLITKNIDYLPIKKPIIICAKKGRASEKIKLNKIGAHLDPENNLSKQLIKLIKNKVEINEKNFDTLIKKYNLKNITKKILEE